MITDKSAAVARGVPWKQKRQVETPTGERGRHAMAAQHPQNDMSNLGDAVGVRTLCRSFALAEPATGVETRSNLCK